jgi:hypothetical protein
MGNFLVNWSTICLRMTLPHEIWNVLRMTLPHEIWNVSTAYGKPVTDYGLPWEIQLHSSIMSHRNKMNKAQKMLITGYDPCPWEIRHPGSVLISGLTCSQLLWTVFWKTTWQLRWSMLFAGSTRNTWEGESHSIRITSESPQRISTEFHTAACQISYCFLRFELSYSASLLGLFNHSGQ